VSAPDAVLLRDWHPVAAAAELQPGKLLAARLLQQDLVLWRTPVGVRAWEDRCPPPFPEYHDPALRKVVCGPYVVETSGPRIVENFLDMAHFPSVHPGILGDPKRTEVRDYEVAPFDDGEGQLGLIATGCRFWQPQTNSLSASGTDVDYTSAGSVSGAGSRTWSASMVSRSRASRRLARACAIARAAT
jgi:phenylpropionate dioxygenase-like ring-hydroxylating dioxygenase large terminal subunit